MVMLRNTAYTAKISEIMEGEFKKEENLSYVELGSRKLSRVNIIGTIVSKQDKEADIDDCSGIISIREFDTKLLDKINVGDVALVVGKLRSMGPVFYVLPEIVKKTDIKWLMVRVKELGSDVSALETRKAEPVLINETVSVQKKELISGGVKEEFVEDIVSEKNPTLKIQDKKITIDAILDFVRKNDSGTGVDIDAIIEKMHVKEERIQELLKQGELFVVKPGRVKVLE
jgi:RPA family protein